ncbi:unnamed protein product [Microthlaspi erraticum]|uniref:Alpha-N-acetylglucosaminidase C-terminal domain-containing protein n=1 Tax=Microthlaspi erraticum TaxID=1685480 RepID=A0A6D2IUX9_9BRAS|nr:unnamed protein product [Microthlaspi erraticum]
MSAFVKKDVGSLRRLSEKFLELIKDFDVLLASDDNFLLRTWLVTTNSALSLPRLTCVHSCNCKWSGEWRCRYENYHVFNGGDEEERKASYTGGTTPHLQARNRSGGEGRGKKAPDWLSL